MNPQLVCSERKEPTKRNPVRSRGADALTRFLRMRGGAAVGGKKEGEIKSSYLAAVTAIEAWCAESGLDSSIKGL
jgi:hypothetical protein